MGTPTRFRQARTGLAALWLLWLLALAACAPIRLVSDYDAEAAKAITDTSAEALAFYDRMITDAAGMKKPAKLPYEKYKEGWSAIETKLRVMVIREESRPLNSESERIAQGILKFWETYRDMHLKADNYQRSPNDDPLSLMKLHRDRFQRLFAAALRAEKAKQLANPDLDPSAAQ